MFQAVIDWLTAHSGLLSGITGLSVLMLLVTLIATPWLIARLPSDYFINNGRAAENRGSGIHLRHLIRNLAGATLIILGLIMLITPGPGIVVLLVGLSIAEFPGKLSILRALVRKPNVFKSLNWIREQRNCPPFLQP